MQTMKTAQKRLAAGRPLPANTATCADAIALLAGVNFGTTVKVLAALEAIKLTVPMPPGLNIARVIDIPLTPPRFDGTDEDRVRATQHLVHMIAGNERVQYLDSILHMSGRFQTRKLADSYAQSRL